MLVGDRSYYTCISHPCIFSLLLLLLYDAIDITCSCHVTSDCALHINNACRLHTKLLPLLIKRGTIHHSVWSSDTRVNKFKVIGHLDYCNSIVCVAKHIFFLSSGRSFLLNVSGIWLTQFVVSSFNRCVLHWHYSVNQLIENIIIILLSLTQRIQTTRVNSWLLLSWSSLYLPNLQLFSYVIKQNILYQFYCSLFNIKNTLQQSILHLHTRCVSCLINNCVTCSC